MSVGFMKVQPPCVPSEIQALLDASPEPLPEDYVKFLRSQNGGRPEPNEFLFDDYGSGVTDFLGASQVLEKKREISGLLPGNWWPIAEAEGGNLVLLRQVKSAWSITFWDHELDEEIELSTSFTEFLDMLQPIATPQAQAKVISAWIDPSFLKG
ncbi:SMI1/KNR4 family protein [Sorangium sp. So ce429]